MPTPVSDLAVNLSANTSKFQTDMGRAARMAEKEAKRMQAAFKAVGVAAGVYLGTQIVRAVNGMVTAMKSGIDRADELYNAAQKIGVSVEALSGLEYAAKLAGVSLDQLQGGLAKMTKFQAEASKGGKEAVRVFETLGIAVKDASGHLRGTTDVLGDFADIFARLPDGPEKTALALKAFGRSGAELIPLLNEGRAGIKAMTDEAARLGVVLSTEDARSADELNDKLDKLQTTFQGIATEVGLKVLPRLIELVDKLQAATERGEGLTRAADLLTTVMGGVGWVLEKVDQFARGLGLGFAHAAAQAANLRMALEGLGKHDASMMRQAGINALKDANQFVEDRAWILHGGGPADAKANTPGGKIQWIDAPAAKPKAPDLGGLFSPDAKKGGGGRNKAADEAARRAKEAQRELEEQIRLTTQATDQFNRISQDSAAELAGPLAQALLGHTRRMAELDALQKAGNITADEFKAAKDTETALYEREKAAIEKRLDVGGALLSDLQFELSLVKMTNAERATAIQLRGMDAESIQKYGEAIKQANDDVIRAQQEHDKLTGAMDSFRASFEDGLSSFLTGSKSFKDAIKDMADAFAQQIARMIAEWMSLKLLGEPGSTGGGALGGVLGKIFGMFGSSSGSTASLPGAFSGLGALGYANGTDYAPGGPAWVGERGKELVNLPRGSQVIPNHKIGGMRPVVVNFNGVGNVTKETGQQAATKVRRAVAMAGRDS